MGTDGAPLEHAGGLFLPGPGLSCTSPASARRRAPTPPPVAGNLAYLVRPPLRSQADRALIRDNGHPGVRVEARRLLYKSALQHSVEDDMAHLHETNIPSTGCPVASASL